jgi:hypothetical protein
VIFFKTLLSSDGHPFKCLQLTVDIAHARNTDRAVKAAKRHFERLHHVSDWTLHADTFEVEIDEKKEVAGAEARLPQGDTNTRGWNLSPLH